MEHMHFIFMAEPTFAGSKGGYMKFFTVVLVSVALSLTGCSALTSGGGSKAPLEECHNTTLPCSVETV
jgi:hypothetical protein